MINSTLCYIEYGEYMLFLFRNKKKNDLNEGKYVGVGGKFLEGETSDECLIRETFEETGLKIHDYSFRGIVDFISDTWEDEKMHLYSAVLHGDEGIDIKTVLNTPAVELPASKGAKGIKVPIECNEGTLYLVKKADILLLNMWDGDVKFLEPLLKNENQINMTLKYEGDTLVDYVN